jgi:hypothetical protein
VVRRTEITIEREVVSMRFDAESGYQGFCPECGGPMLMISAEAASAGIGATKRQVYRWIEENRFHIQESGSGETFLCSASVAAHGATMENRGLLGQGGSEESN